MPKEMLTLIAHYPTYIVIGALASRPQTDIDFRTVLEPLALFSLLHSFAEMSAKC